MEFAGLAGIQLRDRRLEFDDRIVTLAFSTPERLARSLDVLNDVAELRRAKESAGVLADIGARDQAEWLRDLQERTTRAPDDAPAEAAPAEEETPDTTTTDETPAEETS